MEAGQSESSSSRYARIIAQPAPPTKPAARKGARPRSRPGPRDGTWASLRPALDLVLPEEPLEEPAVALLVAKNRDHHVVGDGVDLLGLLDDARVVLYGAVLGVYYALDYVDHVDLVPRRLELLLDGLEVHRARHRAVELLDALRELLRVRQLLLDVLLDVLLDLLGPDAVRVDGAGDVVHHRLELHEVCGLQELDDGLALLGQGLREDALASPVGFHGT